MGFLDDKVVGIRLKQKRLEKEPDISSRKFAMKAGVDASHYSKIEKGELPVTDKILQKLIDTYGIDRDYILFGTNVPHEAKSLPTQYLERRRSQKNNLQPYMVPLVSVKAQAGYTKAFMDPVFIESLDAFPIVPGIDPLGAQWRYFEIEGNSMLETFKPGQYLLASQVIKEDWKNIENFHVYVVITEDRVMVKRLAKVKGKEYWAAISDNETEFKQFKLPVDSVQELWRYRRHIDWDASPPKRFEVKV